MLSYHGFPHQVAAFNEKPALHCLLGTELQMDTVSKYLVNTAEHFDAKEPIFFSELGTVETTDRATRDPILDLHFPGGQKYNS